jgi:hypothetical protein
MVSNAVDSTNSPPVLLRVQSVAVFDGDELLTNGTYTYSNTPTFNIFTAYPNGSIFYTLDGTEPSFVSTPYQTAITLTSNATLRAIAYSDNFSESQEADTVSVVVLLPYTLTATSPGGGSVGLNPPGGSYLGGSTVSVAANPSPGWQFLYWLGDASGSSSTTNVTVNSDMSVIAVFGTTLSTTVEGNGQVTLYPSETLYPYGQIVRLEGIPGAGSFFGVWGDNASGNTNPLYYAVTEPTQTVSSVFGTTAGNQAALTVLINGHGSVAVSPRANVYATNSSITLTAMPDSGASFVDWSGGATGTQNPLPIVLNQSEVITANFTANPALRVEPSEGDGLGPKGFRLTLMSDPASVFHIYVSSNLTSWTCVCQVTNTTGVLQWTDASATSGQPRYYRTGP